MSLLVIFVLEYYIPLLVGVAITFITYWWLHHLKYLSKLKWTHSVPGLPILGCILELSKSTEILEVFSNYCKRYNGLCRLNLVGKQFLLVSDHKFLEYVLSTNDIMDKNDSYKFLKNWLGSGLITAGAAKWKESRKILTPSFHYSILNEFLEVFESNAIILVRKLENEVGKSAVDVFPYVTMCTLDNICESAMGVSINAQTDKQSEYVFAVKEMCRITVDRTFSPIKMYDTLYPLTRDYYKEKRYVKTLHSKTDSVIFARQKELIEKRRQEQKSPQADEELGDKKRVAFLDLMLQSFVDGKPMSNEDIRQEVDTFMFADDRCHEMIGNIIKNFIHHGIHGRGHDTTSTAISFVIYCLAKHPEHQDEVAKELENIFSDEKNRSMTSRDLQEMKYLEMVIKETLRLYPSVPFIGRMLNKDIHYEENKFLPKGLSLILYIYELHRNPEFFPEPEKFDPSRFDNGKRPPPYTYVPFSAGPRNCIGQKFAMMEMKATLAQILRKFEIVSCGHELILAAETLLISKNGFKVALKLRN